MSEIRKKIQDDDTVIEELLHGTFGPGRFARSVYRLREKVQYNEDYSYVYETNRKIIASISFCQTSINKTYKGLLLGPLAVEPNHVGKGYGKKLVQYSLDLISKNNEFYFITVVGDYNYYKEFGFNKINIDFRFYGPVNKDKVLIKINNPSMQIKEIKQVNFL